MKKQTINIILVLAILTAIKTPLLSQKPILPKEKNNKWALVQGRNKVTEYRYDTIQNNFNDYFVVKLNEKWGILNQKGEVIIPFEYDEIEDFYLGRLKVKVSNVFGIIDTTGTKLCELKYLEIDNFGRDSTILVKDEFGWKYIKDGQTINKEIIVFKNPDQISVYGDCQNHQKQEEIKKCSKDQILDIVFQNLKYPKYAVENGISGMVIVSFWISPTGEISNKTILRDIGGGCGQAGLDVIDYLKNWKSAIKNGEKVWSEFILPIRFSLN